MHAGEISPGSWVAGRRWVLALHLGLTALAPPPPQSTARKMDIIKGLFVACRHAEARYITR